jgi:hypothetical protein
MSWIGDRRRGHRNGTGDLVGGSVDRNEGQAIRDIDSVRLGIAATLDALPPIWSEPITVLFVPSSTKT